MKTKAVSLALQGGGSHGAFTWGVLDRLLEDERIALGGVSGASAGAINAVVLAHGLTAGGRAGARAALTRFWESVMTNPPFDLRTHNGVASPRASNPAVESLLMMSRFLSPYQFNPLNVNPLGEILASQIDFERLRARCELELFIAATEVSSGMPRTFRTRELTADMLLASACVPSLHHPVNIDGAAYWDGGLTANPPLRPLLYQCEAADILIVLLQPSRRLETPKTAEDIWRRFNEISFSSALFSELQGIALAKQEAERHQLPSVGRLERRLKRLNMHCISPPAAVSRMHPLSRLDTHSTLIKMLHHEGRAQAATWLEENFRWIGKRSTFSFAPHLIAAPAG
jgi:NTE family protein